MTVRVPGLQGIVNSTSAVTWSVQIRDPDSGATLFEHRPDTVCATASIGKILLLITAAEAIHEGALDPQQMLSRASVAPVSDSGQWQHLLTDQLPLADVCALIGSTSDNLATNVLIDTVGLDAVATTASRLGFADSGLHDIVRDVRRPADPPALSTGSAAALTSVCSDLARPRQVAADAAALVVKWLSTNTDLSMVAGAFGLDPLAHTEPDRMVLLWNKTGTNVGVRCDVGVVAVGGNHLTYAALANWTVVSDQDPVRDEVLSLMRTLGAFLAAALEETRS